MKLASPPPFMHMYDCYVYTKLYAKFTYKCYVMSNEYIHGCLFSRGILSRFFADVVFVHIPKFHGEGLFNMSIEDFHEVFRMEQLPIR